MKTIIVRKPINTSGLENVIIEPHIDAREKAPHCMVLEGCRGVVVRNGTLFNPGGSVDDPEDPVGHCGQFDKGCDVTFENVHCQSNAKGDMLSLFNCEYGYIVNCRFSGKLAEKTWECIVDGPDGRACTIRDMSLKKGVLIAGGAQHSIINVKAGIIAVSGEYYLDRGEPRIVNVLLDRVTCKELYVGPGGFVRFRGCRRSGKGVRSR